MMSFLFLLLFVLKVLFLAVCGSSESILPPQTLDWNLKHCEQQNGWVLLLEGKPPPNSKHGKNLVQQCYKCLEEYHCCDEDLCQPGACAELPRFTHDGQGRMKSVPEDRGFLHSRPRDNTLNHFNRTAHSIFSEGKHQGSSKDLEENRLNLASLEEASAIDVTILRHSISKESKQRKLLSIPNTSEKIITVLEEAIPTTMLCTANSHWLISKFSTCFDDLKRNHQEISPTIHSPPVPVKMKI